MKIFLLALIAFLTVVSVASAVPHAHAVNYSLNVSASVDSDAFDPHKPITRAKEKTHQRLFRIATDTMVSGLAATMVVLALKFGGILR